VSIGEHAASGRVILLAKQASFEAGYVSAVLNDRGIEVLAPAPEVQGVVQAIVAGERCSVIVCHTLSAQDRADLLQALTDHDVPCLTLIGPMVTRTANDEPVLARPFAAYQVADWVAKQQMQR
jgi:aspartate/glutamate racemase